MAELTRSRTVYFFFFLSGIAALVYEIIWTRMLTLVFGHTVYSVSIVLAAFMAGLGFGSYLWGHIIDRVASRGEDTPPLLVYGLVEILIFATGATLSLIFYKFHVFYAWIHQWVPESIALFNVIKAVLAFLLMFIPTTFMGATLPIISKYYVTDNKRLGTQIGLLYALNTMGAAVGCLATGFVLISALGVLQTALAASAANLLIGIGCIRIYQEENPGKKTPFRLPRIFFPKVDWSAEQKLWMTVSFVSGMTALAYEVLWTRLLVFSIASTVYSFSMMLAVFLFGICLGSLVVVPLVSRFGNLRTLLMGLQAGIGIWVFISLYNMEYLLSPPWNSYNLKDPLATFLHYLRDSAALMLVPTILLGMNFPILIKLASGSHDHVGRGTGQIYAANTLGAILGSLLAGFLFLPYFGMEKSLVLTATFNFLMIPLLLRTGPMYPERTRKLLTPAIVAGILMVNFAIPSNLLDRFFMRDSVGPRDQKSLLFFEEGITDTVAVFKDGYGMLDPSAKRLITNGISMSASNVIATRYMKLFAHVPILLSDSPEEVLVICFGTGQTTGAAGIHPRVKRVDSLDLSASVIHAAPAFKEENHDVLNNPKVHIILQDGRNHLLTTRKQYDVITGEPPPPRTAFTVNLYTRDFYELARKRLKPGGIIAQWVPLHSQSADEVDMHFKTFMSVFPYAIAWMSVANEILLIGSDRPIEMDFKKIRDRFGEEPVRRAMEAIYIPTVHSFLSNIWFLEEEMKKLSKDAPLITDNRPRIEFYLDLGNVIGMWGLERLVFNRTPAETIWKRIRNMEYPDWKIFERQYRVMDLYQRGVMYANRSLLLEALRLGGDNELIRYHLQAGKDMIERLEARLQSDPEDFEALLNLGHVYYQLGRYQESLGYLDRVLARVPDQPVALLYRGYDLLELDRLEEALKVFKEVVKRDPGQLRTVLQQIGFVELRLQLAKNPDDLNLMNAVAKFYNMRNEYQKALEYAEKVLEKDPLNKEALQSAVFANRGMGWPNEVLGYGVRYEMVDPEDIHFQYIMAEMYVKTLRCRQALPYLEKILARDDTYPNAQRLYNECQSKTGSESGPAA